MVDGHARKLGFFLRTCCRNSCGSRQNENPGLRPAQVRLESDTTTLTRLPLVPRMLKLYVTLCAVGLCQGLTLTLDRRCFLGGICVVPAASYAVSGGGKDFAEATIKGKDFSGQSLNNKDFSGADAVDANFAGAKLRGARFFKSDCARVDFSGADLTSASLEGSNLEGAKLTGAVAEGAAFSQTIGDAADISDVDFTDAVIQPSATRRPRRFDAPSTLRSRRGPATRRCRHRYMVKQLCGRPDAKGRNKVTGVETRDSLFCQ